MRTLVLVLFWMWLVVGVLRVLVAGILDYPKTTTTTRTEAVIGGLLTLACAAGAAWLLWFPQ